MNDVAKDRHLVQTVYAGLIESDQRRVDIDVMAASARKFDHVETVRTQERFGRPRKIDFDVERNLFQACLEVSQYHLAVAAPDLEGRDVDLLRTILTEISASDIGGDFKCDESLGSVPTSREVEEADLPQFGYRRR